MWDWLKMIGLRKKTKREIIVNAESLETRVAIMEDEHLEEFSIERPTEERIVGGIYKGRIQNLEDGLQAAFVDIGLKKNAFIHYWDMIPEDAARLEAEEGVAANRPRRKKVQPGEMAKLFPAGSAAIWTFAVAVLFAANARSAFLEPLFLIMVMTTFHVSVENQPINLEWDARLTSLSGKFKELKDKAAAWVSGQPAPAAT